MSLQTDRIFLAALRASTDIAARVGDRIFPIAIPGSDDDLLNIALPYIVVTFDGLQNSIDTKDNPYMGDEDKVQIGIEIGAESPDGLSDLADLVREQIDTFITSYTPAEGEEDLTPLIPSGYDFSTSEKSYDWMRPCYYMKMIYNCDTSI